MLLESLYAAIGHLVHLGSNVYDFWCLLQIQWHALLLWSYDICRSTAARELHERSILEHCYKQLSKRPQHLCVIVAPDSKQVNADVLQRLLSYAFLMNIKCVSVYDTRRAVQNAGYVELEKLLAPKGVHTETIKCKNSRKSVIIWRWREQVESTKLNGLSKNAQKNGYKNGNTSNGHIAAADTDLGTLEIHQINAEDGHTLIAQVCQELFEKRNTPAVQKLLQNRPELTQQIDTALQRHLGLRPEIAEPDLGIVFARQTCTFGMLPWHIRFTEFHRIASEQYFNADTFAEVLYKYSHCEQRWGK